eukprot:Hpha_TRINITY_DN15178_c4_g5::TRINITY_DN15178_c4_g5_i1::g.129706::m.129706
MPEGGKKMAPPTVHTEGPAAQPAQSALGPPPSPMSGTALQRRTSGSFKMMGSATLEAALRQNERSGIEHRGSAGVVDTNDDATAHKARAVALGYWQDPFALRFVRKGAIDGRGSPLMNRGYFARVRFVNNALSAFFEAEGDEPCQVLNLGCGYDTAFWRLTHHNALPKSVKSWVEVDFPEVVGAKNAVIDAMPEMKRMAEGKYHAVVADLRCPKELTKVLLGEEGAPGPLSRDLPTFVLSECVLIYMQPGEGDAVLDWCTENMKRCCFTTYEQVHPETPFGKRMVENLSQRGCPLLAIEKYPDLEAQKKRYLEHGFVSSEAHTMNECWERVPFTERRRVDRIEMLDEMEEWTLIHNHYCFVCAVKAQPEDKISSWLDQVFKRPPPPTLPDGRPLAVPPHTPAGGIIVD